MIESFLYHYVCLAILFGVLSLIPFAQERWSKWRKYKPLNGRPYFFVVWFNVIVAILVGLCIAFTFVILYDKNAYLASLVSTSNSIVMCVEIHSSCRMGSYPSVFSLLCMAQLASVLYLQSYRFVVEIH